MSTRPNQPRNDRVNRNERRGYNGGRYNNPEQVGQPINYFNNSDVVPPNRYNNVDPMASNRPRFDRPFSNLPGILGASHANTNFGNHGRLQTLVQNVVSETDLSRQHQAVSELTQYLAAPDTTPFPLRIYERAFRTLERSLLSEATSSEFRLSLATCIGRLAAARSEDPAMIFQWLFSNLSTNQPKGTMLLFVRMLQEAVDHSHRQHLISYMPLVLMHVQTTLESVDSFHYLDHILAIIRKSATDYPEIFAGSFQDIVDLLVGLHIDADSTAAIRADISETFRHLRVFFGRDLGFTLTLLDQFLSDIEGYLREDKEAKALSSVLALLSCFESVIASLSDLSRSDGIQLRFFTVFRNILLKYPGTSWLYEANRALLTVVRLSSSLQSSSLDIILLEIERPMTQDADITAWLQIFLELLQLWRGKLTVRMIRALVLPSSPFLNLRLRMLSSSAGRQQLLQIYQLLGFANSLSEPTLQTLLSHLTAEIVAAVQALVEKSASKLPASATSSSDFSDISNVITSTGSSSKAAVHLGSLLLALAFPSTYSPLEAAQIAIVGLQAVRSLLSQPSTDDASMQMPMQDELYRLAIRLVTSSTTPTTLWHVHAFVPAVLHTLMYTIVSAYDKLSRDKAYFSTTYSDTTLRLLRVILKDINLPLDTVLLCFACLETVMSQSDVKNPIWPDVAIVLSKWIEHAEIEARQLTLRLLLSYVTLISNGTLPSLTIVLAVLRRLDDINEGVRVYAAKVLQQLSPTWCLQLLEDNQQLHDQDNAALLFTSFEAHLYHSLPSGLFRPSFFLALFKQWAPDDAKIQEVQPSSESSSMLADLTDEEGRLRLFAFCRSYPTLQSTQIPPNLRPIVPLDLSFVQSSRDGVRLWSAFEAARHCINSRLRTNLGSPTQTFEMIEKAVRSLDRPLHDGVDDINKDFLLRSYELLLFVDLLEKQIFHSYEGVFSYAPVPKGSVTFFRTNRRVCEEWFLRVRLPLFNAAWRLAQLGVESSFGLVLNHGELRIRDLLNLLRKSANDKDGLKLLRELQRSIQRLAVILVKLGDSFALNGWAAFCRNLVRRSTGDLTDSEPADQEPTTTPSKRAPATPTPPATEVIVPTLLKSTRSMQGPMASTLDSFGQTQATWLDIFALRAEGNVETAIQNLDKLLTSEMRGLDEDAQDFLQMQFVQWCVDASDWATLTSWKERGMAAGFMRATPTSSWPSILRHKSVLEALEAWDSDIISGTKNPARKFLPDDTVRQSLFSFSDRFTYGLLNSLSSDSLKKSAFATRLTDIAALSSFTNINPGALEYWMHSQLLEKTTYDVIDATKFKSMMSDISLYTSLLRCSKMQNQRFIEHVGHCAVSSHNIKLGDRLLQSVLTVQANPSELLLYNQANLLQLSNQTEAALGQFISLGSRNDLSRNIRVSAWLKAHDILAASSSNFPIEDITARLSTLISTADLPDTLLTPVGETQVPSTIVAALLATEWKDPTHSKRDDCSDARAWWALADWNAQQAQTYQLSGASQSSAMNALRAQLNAALPDYDEEKLLTRLNDAFSQHDRTVDGVVNDEELDKLLLNVLPSSLSKDVARQIVASVRSIHKIQIQFLSNVIIASTRGLINLASSKNINSFKAMSVSLTVLDIFINHALHLSEMACKMLTSEETLLAAPWYKIVPQLTPRLSHSVTVVRRSVLQILLHVAKTHPSAVLNPVLAALNESPSVELQTLFMSLSDQHPLLASETRLFADELQRISVLWEESWVHLIIRLQNEVTRRLHRIDNETRRMRDNTALSSEERQKLLSDNYSAVLRPIILPLERLLMSTLTRTEPLTETPHETWFRQTYESRIMDAFAALRAPGEITSTQPLSTTAKDAFNLFKDLSRDLNTFLSSDQHKKLSLDTLSPALVSAQFSAIEMPGVFDEDGKPLHLRQIEEEVIVLHTKTMPKKIVLRGDDGKSYPYLVKGVEDLRLDERVMQWIQVAANILHRSQHRTRDQRKYVDIRSYKVIPLGPNCGLIQWVQYAIPLFSVYKRWQQREAMSKDTPIQRPSDMFNNTVSALLAKHSMTLKTPRSQWPLPVLRKALDELEAITPPALLESELWCASSDLAGWWQRRWRYTASCAAMSIVGHVLGIGDRHLDNILVDLATGEVVHIDFNVCFEKGKKLRVPERVPFRLTRMLERAFGITGVEGVFRSTCEFVLGELRQERSTLLSLLSTFIDDPLTEWRTSRQEYRERAQLELVENMHLLASRFAASRAALEKSRDLLLSHASSLSSSSLAVQQIDDTIRLRLEELAAAKARLVLAIPALQNSLDAHTMTLMTQLQDAQAWLAKHQQALLTVQAGVYPRRCMEDAYGRLGRPLSFTVLPVLHVLQTRQDGLLPRWSECQTRLRLLADHELGLVQQTMEHLLLYLPLTQNLSAESLIEFDPLKPVTVMLNEIVHPNESNAETTGHNAAAGGGTDAAKPISSFTPQAVQHALQTLQLLDSDAARRNARARHMELATQATAAHVSLRRLCEIESSLSKADTTTTADPAGPQALLPQLKKRAEGFLRGGKGSRGERRLNAFHGALLWLSRLALQQLDQPVNFDKAILAQQFDETETPAATKDTAKKAWSLVPLSVVPVVMPSHVLLASPVIAPASTSLSLMLDCLVAVCAPLISLPVVAVEAFVTAGVATDLWLNCAESFMPLMDASSVVFEVDRLVATSFFGKLETYTGDSLKRLQSLLRPLAALVRDANLVGSSVLSAPYAGAIGQYEQLLSAHELLSVFDRSCQPLVDWLKKLPSWRARSAGSPQPKEAAISDEERVTLWKIIAADQTLTFWETRKQQVVYVDLFAPVHLFLETCLRCVALPNARTLASTLANGATQFLEKVASATQSAPATTGQVNVKTPEKEDEKAKNLLSQRDVSAREVGVVCNMALEWARAEVARKLLAPLTERIKREQSNLEAIHRILSQFLWSNERLLVPLREETIAVALNINLSSEPLIPINDRWFMEPSSILLSLTQSLTRDEYSLTQFVNDWNALNADFGWLEAETLKIVMAAAGADSNLQRAAEVFASNIRERLSLFETETAMVTDMIALCQTLVHFESSRALVTIPSPSGDIQTYACLGPYRESLQNALLLATALRRARTSQEEQQQQQQQQSAIIFGDDTSTPIFLHNEVVAIEQSVDDLRGPQRAQRQKAVATLTGAIADAAREMESALSSIQPLVSSALNLDATQDQSAVFSSYQDRCRALLKSWTDFQSAMEVMASGKASLQDVGPTITTLVSSFWSSLEEIATTSRVVPVASPSSGMVGAIEETTETVDEDAGLNNGAPNDDIENDADNVDRGDGIYSNMPLEQVAVVDETSVVPAILPSRQRDPTTRPQNVQKLDQGPNPIALSALARVRNKLDGLESSTSAPLSITEQVNFVIQAATSRDRLSRMYEGWTAWI